MNGRVRQRIEIDRKSGDLVIRTEMLPAAADFGRADWQLAVKAGGPMLGRAHD